MSDNRVNFHSKDRLHAEQLGAQHIFKMSLSKEDIQDLHDKKTV